MAQESYAYPAEVVIDSGEFVYQFRDIPEAIGQSSANKFIDEAIEILEMTLIDFYMKNGKRIPYASKPRRGEVVVDLPLTFVGKIILHNAMLDQRIRPVDLARAMNLPTSEIARITNPKRKTKIDTLAAAVEACGKKMRLVYE